MLQRLFVYYRIFQRLLFLFCWIFVQSDFLKWLFCYYDVMLSIMAQDNDVRCVLFSLPLYNQLATVLSHHLDSPSLLEYYRQFHSRQDCTIVCALPSVGSNNLGSNILLTGIDGILRIFFPHQFPVGGTLCFHTSKENSCRVESPSEVYIPFRCDSFRLPRPFSRFQIFFNSC